MSKSPIVDISLGMKYTAVMQLRFDRAHKVAPLFFLSEAALMTICRGQIYNLAKCGQSNTEFIQIKISLLVRVGSVYL
jgi:hypothetical protein